MVPRPRQPWVRSSREFSANPQTTQWPRRRDDHEPGTISQAQQGQPLPPHRGSLMSDKQGNYVRPNLEVLEERCSPSITACVPDRGFQVCCTSYDNGPTCCGVEDYTLQVSYSLGCGP